ncbi:leucine-rich repeat-containing protein kinase family protein [Rufibacter tibetensis]|uniref:Protein kinase n=1 Tax=Rufibacter tibetensis TaxID=512763 RepID=A0A0P0CVC4_9BACT|nr:leucine-rich repeat-containing protein kinase family protein [Rufibacter tibetensis]ALI98397.1 protein kinase [Rufibacter tibetensis]
MHTLEQLQAGELAGATRVKLSCNLTEVPSEIFDLAETLEILDLSGNHLTSLPDAFTRLQNLRIAFFSDNDFTVFPEVLGKLPRLEMIGFKACQIGHIAEDAIPHTTRWLILTNNQIAELPASIGKCTRMQKLMLAGNKLKALPPELASCQNLELFRISANQITHLPDWLFSLPRLSWLAISGNPCNPPASTATDLPEISWQDLVLEEQLGEGASGIISRAHWQNRANSTHQVAVKVFKGEVTSDGLPEDEMQACMRAGAHPNLVQVLGKLGQHPAQKQGLVFELIPAGYRNLGGSPSFESCTRDVYAEDTVFTLEEAISISLGVASATAHLHARGISHGDLYAHNTLVDETGHPLFGDFGAATVYDQANTTLATALERLEVRAFGCLLEDLLDHLTPEAMAQERAQRLLQLKQVCMQPEVQNRPAFSFIVEQIESISKQVMPSSLN